MRLKFVFNTSLIHIAQLCVIFLIALTISYLNFHDVTLIARNNRAAKSARRSDYEAESPILTGIAEQLISHGYLPS